jgi:hypothetical protein
MQVIIEKEEGWSMMSLITSYVIDSAGLSADGKASIRQWRTNHDKDSDGTADITDAMNEALGTYIEDRTNRTVRKKGHYARKAELK